MLTESRIFPMNLVLFMETVTTNDKPSYNDLLIRFYHAKKKKKKKKVLWFALSHCTCRRRGEGKLASDCKLDT